MGLATVVDIITEKMKRRKELGIDVENEVVIVLELRDVWVWRRVNIKSGELVSMAGKGYINAVSAVEAAEAYNPGVTVNVLPNE